LPPSQGSPARGAAPLLRTPPGRAIVVGVAVKLIVALYGAAAGAVPSTLGVVDLVAGFAIAAGASYFLVRLFILAKRRLLWRVRRKLILSYIFIGVVPAVLIATFFVLGALLLFFNFSSYLVQSEIEGLGDRVRLVATSLALELQLADGGATEVLARVGDRPQPDLPALSAAVVPADRSCATGASSSARRSTAGTGWDGERAASKLRIGLWTHADPPAAVPDWIDCGGFTGLMAHRYAGADTAGMFVRAVAFPDTPMAPYAVIVDVPVDDSVKSALRRSTGVELQSATFVDVGTTAPVQGPGAGTALETPNAGAGSGPLSWVTFLEYREWTSGEQGTLVVSTQVNIQDMYARISAAPGVVGPRPFGQALLLVLLVVVGGLFLIIEGVALVVGSALARSITGSVHELFAGTERVRQGDFSHKISITARDQLGELATSFNSMTASIENLLREAAEKKRLEEELRIAHEIQMSLLPQGPLAMPGLSATALCIPAREVGGDYYDFLPLDGHRVGILIADVSGKGTSAALYMAQLKGLILSLSTIHTSPRALLVAANRSIAKHLDARSFITVAYAVVDLGGRTMTYARAGHTPLIHVPGQAGASPPRPDESGERLASTSGGDAPSGGRRARILAPSGMVVGLKIDDGEMFEQQLEEQTIPLTAGDLYLFFTDGISEAMNSAGDCFGEVRLGRLAEAHADLPSEELRERILHEVSAFVDGAPQHDDMTMVLVKVDEAPLPATETTMGATQTVPASSR
jgi:sigma-B regulation protein RsbU (phosphoserine phosphatase)